MATKKELTSNEHNNLIFAEIKKLEDKIADLKSTMKPVEAVKTATLAECNEMTRKNKLKFK